MIKILVTDKGVYKSTNNMVQEVNGTTYINNGSCWIEIGKCAHMINLDSSTKVEEIDYLMEKLTEHGN